MTPPLVRSRAEVAYGVHETVRTMMLNGDGVLVAYSCEHDGEELPGDERRAVVAEVHCGRGRVVASVPSQ